MKTLAFAIMLALFAVPVTVNAAQTPAPGSLRAACAADTQTLCPNMAPGDQRKCLMSNSSKVSQDCGTAIANAKSAMRAYQQACGVDIRQSCGTQPAGPARHQCVVANSAHFSPACQTALAALQQAPGR